MKRHVQDLLEFESPALLSLLTAEAKEELLRAARMRSYEDRQRIHSRGDANPGLSIIIEGAVQMSNMGRDDKSVITTVLGTGQTYGEFTIITDLPRSHDAHAVGETKVAFVHKSAFQHFLKSYPDICYQLLVVTTRRLYDVLEFTDDLRRLPMDVNIAKLLLNMLRTAKVPDEIECSQADIALTLGVTRTSVNKILAQFASEGLVVLGYGKIKIHQAALRTWIGQRGVSLQ